LLHGMRGRIDSVSGLSSRQSATWQGIQDGYQLQLNVICEDAAAVRIALFPDPRWWLAAPVQVREAAGPGSCTIDRLPAGSYYIGAIQRVGDEIIYGVEKHWPQPVVISEGVVAQAEVLLSRHFSDLSFGVGGRPRATFDGRDLTNLTSIKVVDEQTGDAVPFCRIVLRERQIFGRPDFIHTVHGNHDGMAYISKMTGRFFLSAQRFDFVPETFTVRYVALDDVTLHDPTTLPDVQVSIAGYPTGQHHLKGKVHDQFGKPLTR
jgi:hypothetical protein